MSEIMGFVGTIIKLTLGLVIALVGLALWSYNSLRRLAENVKEARSNIKVAVGRKTQVVNDLTALVLRYHEDEQLMMLKVSEDTTIASVQAAYRQADSVLSTINGMAQRFPELQSNEQFGKLMANVGECEEGIQSVRQIYNAQTKEYNVHRGSIPHLLYSSILGFHAAKYLDFDEMHSEAGVADPAISDDGERMRVLMGLAGTKALEATKNITQQGRVLAEKTFARAQGRSDSPSDGQLADPKGAEE